MRASPARKADAIFKEFARTLQAMGLEMVENKAESDLAQLKDQRGLGWPAAQGSNASTLSFDVADGETLERFFKSITLRDIEDDRVKRAVAFLAKALDEDFVYQYVRVRHHPETARWEELQEPLLNVASELQRLK